MGYSFNLIEYVNRQLRASIRTIDDGWPDEAKIELQTLIRNLDELESTSPIAKGGAVDETEHFFLVSYVGMLVLDCGGGKTVEAGLFTRPRYPLSRLVLFDKDVVESLVRDIKAGKDSLEEVK